MANSDDQWVRPRLAAPVDPVTKLRSEVGVLSSAVGDVAVAVRRQQVALVMMSLVLGLFLQFARTDTGDRDDEIVSHHLFGVFGKLFDSDLEFVGGGHDSRSAGLGRVLMLIGIALLLIGLAAALTGLFATMEASPERAAARRLTWGTVGIAVGLVLTVVGAWILGIRTDITVMSLGLAFMIVTAVLLGIAAADARERV